uniref:Uncharacterized protein n=1 Tax=Acrobeloides nanus TaxID=290746 RepID=A0A914D849_9BILA
MTKILLSTIVFLLFLNSIFAKRLKILVNSPNGWFSHAQFQGKLADVLVDAGHEVRGRAQGDTRPLVWTTMCQFMPQPATAGCCDSAIGRVGVVAAVQAVWVTQQLLVEA